MTQDSEKGSTVCLVCNASIGVSTRNCCPIFKFNVTSSEQPVANILSVILGQEVRKEIVHSDIICKKCYKLCNEVDELQERLTEIKMELNNYYQRTLRKLEGGEDEEDPNTGQIIYIPKTKPPGPSGRRPGRPRKNPPPVKMVVENGEEDVEMVEEALSEEDDVRGIGMDDVTDADYIPTNRPRPPDGLRRVQEVLMSGNNEVQIKLEAVEEDSQSSDQKNMLNKKKLINKKKDSDVPAVIPQMIVSRDNKVYTCLICSADEKVQGDAKTIISHMKSAHEIRLYICDICGVEFLKRAEMSAHFDEHVATEEGDFQCDVCNRIFTNLRLFRVHKRMHMPQPKNHVCETCGKGFLSRNMLDEHMNMHTGLRPYKCGECGKDFASKYSAKAHEKIHLDRPRPYKCATCGKAFITEQNLHQHEKIHTAIRSHTCQICGKSFSSSRNLEVHCVIHTGYKPFICRVCGKAFARKAEIRDHERTHTGEKPYQCEFCGATFGQRSNLQSHKRATHYDDKRYQCIECGKAFKRRRLLDYHIKAAHTGERPYKCQICNATFIYPEHFKKHRRIHTGEKPYQCEVCGKAFNSRDNRNAHRFVHSDKKPYECLVCGMGFMRKPQLYNHMQTQGHVNDTIVVNQPRLTTDEDFIQQATEDVQVEMSMLEGNHPKWHNDPVLDDNDGDGAQDTKMYISELKEHVIIQGKAQGVTENGQYQEQVGHLIIDGQQVHFADGESLELEGGSSLAETLEQHSLVGNGDYTVEAGSGTTTVQTPNGPVHLVQISLSDTADHQATTWFNLVHQ
ncbi:zinc finger protein 420 isoform X1 [Halyomorpha halys]|uniref:zinc finger protein 420 isoform X1 n=1 Tax=Halyomorpha halys TaxID=286706 RepID=UPI0006D4DA81|nr:zinc finger protein 37-like isoform X1 [Halyomorpha halys]XP_014272726.1 zinc finger protein 37-like isoform X1 [Halyomorpha halys]